MKIIHQEEDLQSKFIQKEQIALCSFIFALTLDVTVWTIMCFVHFTPECYPIFWNPSFSYAQFIVYAVSLIIFVDGFLKENLVTLLIFIFLDSIRLMIGFFAILDNYKRNDKVSERFIYNSLLFMYSMLIFVVFMLLTTFISERCRIRDAVDQNKDDAWKLRTKMRPVFLSIIRDSSCFKKTAGAAEQMDEAANKPYRCEYESDESIQDDLDIDYDDSDLEYDVHCIDVPNDIDRGATVSRAVSFV